MKKVIALSTAIVIGIGAFSGCAKKENTETGGELTCWTPHDAAQSMSGYNEMLLYQELEARTGVKVKFIHPVAGSTGQESFNTLLASKNLPDMIETNWSSYAGGPDAAIDDGVIISLNEHLKEWAPNYYEYMEGKKNEANNGLYRAQSMTDEGNYYGFMTLNGYTARGFSGLMVRKDMLDAWGMDIPETIDDWEVVFAKAKAEGFQKPFTCAKDVLSFTGTAHTFNTAYGVGSSFYVEDDEIVFAPFQSGYKAYIAKLAEWVEKGYIDKNFVTNTNTDLEGNMTNGISVACFGYIGSCMGKILPAMAERDPNYELVACPYPVLNQGETTEFQEVGAEAVDRAIAITTACKNVQAAMKWCDYLYSDEGNILKNFGVEGDTFTVETIDGEEHYVYTDKIMHPEQIGETSINQAMWRFVRPANSPGLNQHPDYLNCYYEYQSQKDALVTWNENIEAAKKHALPTLSFTTEESAKIATIEQAKKAAFETAGNEMISGNKSIDDFDTVIADAKAGGYDEILEIYNSAYQRYLKKLER